MSHLNRALLALATAVAGADPCPAEQPRNDFYGAPLPSGAVARLGTLRGRQAGSPGGVAFSPDGKRFVAWGTYGFHVCDAATGRTLLESSVWEVKHARFNADGKSGVALVAGTPVQWEIKPGHNEPVKLPRYGGIPVAALSPDGKLLGLVGLDNATAKVQEIRVYDLATDKVVHELKDTEAAFPDKPFGGPKDPIKYLVFSPDGKKLVLAAQKSLSIWDFATGKRTQLLKAPRLDGGFRAALSPDGKTLISCDYWEDRVRAHDPVTGKELWSVLTGDHHGTRALTFSPDGKTVAHAGESGLIRYRDAATGKETGSLKTGRNTYDVAFSPDGKSVATTVSLGGPETRVYDLATGGERFEYARHELRIEQVGFAVDGKIAITSGSDRTVRVWDAVAGKQLFKIGENDIKDARQTGFPWAMTPDGKALLVARKATIGVWELATGKELRQIEGPEGSIVSLAVTPTGKAIAVLSVERKARQATDAIHHGHAAHVLDFGTGKAGLTLAGLDPAVTQVQVSPDGTLLALGAPGAPYRDGITLHTATGRKLFAFVRSAGVNDPRMRCFAFSPDGQSLFVVTDKLRVWDAVTGEEKKAVAGLSERGYASLVVSSNGRYLAGRGFEGWYVFEASTGKVVWKREVSDGDSRAVAFSPDGTRLLTGSGDGTALIWELPAAVARP